MADKTAEKPHNVSEDRLGRTSTSETRGASLLRKPPPTPEEVIALNAAAGQVSVDETSTAEPTSADQPSAGATPKKTRSKKSAPEVDPNFDTETAPQSTDDFDELYFDDPYGTVTDQDIEVSLLSWYGPSHIKRKTSWRYYLNLGLLALVIALILIFVNQLYLLMMVLAIVFLLIVMTITDPKPVKNIITNYGIYTGDRFYSWEDRGKHFWIEKDNGERVLVVQTKKFPYQIVMLLNKRISEEQLTDLLSNFLTHQKPKKNGVDKLITWFKRTFPLD